MEHGRESHHFNLNKVNLGQLLYTISLWSTSSNIWMLCTDIKTILNGHKLSNFTFQQILKK